jgi:hypothetical protein
MTACAVALSRDLRAIQTMQRRLMEVEQSSALHPHFKHLT